jgi:pimeloyl-ACP methyl ester carboxylesterase
MRFAVRGMIFDGQLTGPEGWPVLLLHGFPQHAGMWDRVLPALHAAGCRTLAYDQRGYSPGASPSEVDDYRLAECAADVLAILDELGWRRVDLVGHDWGALVGWQIASIAPERLRSLTAVSIPHPLALQDTLRDSADQRSRSAYIRLFRVPGKAEEVLLEDDAARLRSMLAGCPRDRIDSYVQPMRRPVALTSALNWYRAMSPADNLGLGPVAVPTTYVWGDRDIAIGPAAAARCAEYLTGEYRFVPLANVGHWVADEAPEELATAILNRIGSSV